jgi:Tfp pilus assembly PilM family ATPase
MGRLIALEWDTIEARCVVARTQGGSATIEDAFAVPLETDSEAEATVREPAVSGEIAAALASRRLGRGEAMIAVGRANVELRLLSLPPAPAEELPELVRFQALREFSALQDDWPLDFFPVPGSPEENEVLAVAIAPDVVLQMRQALATTGQELKRLVLRPCATASLACRRLPDVSEGVSLVIGRLADSVELAILMDTDVVFTRSFRLPKNWQPDTSGEPVVGEVRRTIAAAQNQLHGRRVERIVLCGQGDQDERLLERLQAATQLDVKLLNPLEGAYLSEPLLRQPPAHPDRYAPLLGMVLDEAAGRRHAIDFLNPRRKPVAPSRRRQYIIAGAGAAALLVALVSGVTMRLGSLDKRIHALEGQLRELNKDKDKHQQHLDQVADLDAWSEGNVNWLAELHRVSQKLPPADQARIEQLQAATRAGGGQLVLKGLVDERTTVAALDRSLGDDRHKVMQGRGSENSRDPRYGFEFNETIVIDNATRRPAADRKTGTN